MTPAESSDFERVLPEPVPAWLRPMVEKLGWYAQPKRSYCDSNCLLLLALLSEGESGRSASAVGGLALLPEGLVLEGGENLPRPDAWRAHVWLCIDGIFHDPTYEIAWGLDLNTVEYYRAKGQEMAFSELEASAQDLLLRGVKGEEGTRQNSGLLPKLKSLAKARRIPAM